VSDYANLGLERQVLGQMLSYDGAFDTYVGHGLQRADFYRVVHQQVFDAIAAVSARGETIGLVPVSFELRKAGVLEDVGLAYFAKLPDEALPPRGDQALIIAAELAELAGKREVFEALDGSLEDAAAVASRATSRAMDERRVYDAAGQLQAVRADITRDHAGRIWLGFQTLDGILEGLRPGEVFGLMARPGIGKTLVLCHTARCVAELEEFSHVFFSLEMPAAQIVERIARAHYGLSRGYLRDRLEGGALDVDDYTRAFARFVVVDAPGLSVAQMGAKLRQLQASTLKGIPIRLVTVDHLGLIGGDRKMTTYDRVSTQAREIKELAKCFECSVLLAVQVNRESGGDGSKELGLGAARDSGVVEEAMDYLVSMRRLDRSQVLAPYEREKYRDGLFLKVIKNRHGSPDTEIGVRLDGMTLRLAEDPTLKIPDDDMAKIAAMPLRGRR
jgi:replicative DNA helicase